MIARIWTGAVRRADADAYADYIRETGFAEYGRTAGNRGAWMLRRDDGDRTEFITLSLWDSVDAIKAFAGEDIEAAVLYPEDERYLIDGESSVTHYEVVDQVPEQSGSITRPPDLACASEQSPSRHGSSVRERVTEAIVPRWEWRMFAERFGAAERRLASLATAPLEVSDEQYVLGLRSEASIKVRDALMDIKRLEHVDDHGLEQWRPVMKAAFPLAQADVIAVIEALGTSPADLVRAEYTFDELVAEVLRLVRGRAGARRAQKRARFTVGACMAELSELKTEHGGTRRWRSSPRIRSACSRRCADSAWSRPTSVFPASSSSFAGFARRFDLMTRRGCTDAVGGRAAQPRRAHALYLRHNRTRQGRAPPSPSTGERASRGRHGKGDLRRCARHRARHARAASPRRCTTARPTRYGCRRCSDGRALVLEQRFDAERTLALIERTASPRLPRADDVRAPAAPARRGQARYASPRCASSPPPARLARRT